MTPEEIRHAREQRRRAAILRFRRLARIVAINRSWLSEMEGQLGDNARKNVALITKRKGVKGILSLQEKQLMNTRWEYRTVEEKKRSVMLMCTLRCLAGYSMEVRARLAKVARFLYLKRGRTILREGHEAETLYFVLDGQITVTRRVYNKLDKVWEEVEIGFLGSGDMFGEVALLLDIKRTATVVTTVDTELLCIDKWDFADTLYPPLKRRWTRIQTALNRFSYFECLSEFQRQECFTVSRIQQFDPLQSIYSEDVGNLNPVYFVLSGTCTILQCLKMNYKANQKNKHYELEKVDPGLHTKSQEFIRKLHQDAHNMRKKFAYGLESLSDFEVDANGVLRKSMRQEPTPLNTTEYKQDIEFVEVGTLTCGSVFGLGEEMEHRTIVAKNTVQCLLVPRYWLFDKHQNIGNQWNRILNWLNMSLPSRQKIFEEFLATQRWLQYRRKVVHDVLRENPRVRTLTTNVHDVPLICRINKGL